MTRLAAAAAAACLAAGACAWGPGEPFGELTAALDAGWDAPVGRDAGGGWQRLASDYQVRVEAASWTTTKLVLVSRGEAALAFDPASPPAGYSLCHNGHCHAADGRLVSYEEISAEVSGGAPPAPALELPTGALELVGGSRLELACDGAPCVLERGSIGRVELEVTALAVSGAVRDGRAPARRAEAAFTATIALAAPVRPTAEVELPVDRGSAPRIHLAVAARPGPALFDAVDWAALGAGPIDLTAAAEPAAAARAAIAEVLAELPLAAAVERED